MIMQPGVVLPQSIPLCRLKKRLYRVRDRVYRMRSTKMAIVHPIFRNNCLG